MDSLPQYDFKAGTILLVDKPLGWTSFDVVNKLRYTIRHRLGVRKIKVGHAGTLDPLATGLLIICTGKFTKKLNEFQGLPKTYTGTIQLGATTPSFDAESEINETFPTNHITPELLESARQRFLGEIEQYPPIFSAVKVDGVPLYVRARKGEEVEIKSRKVTIYDFKLTRVEGNEVDFEVVCSKGTYIRSLANDFGIALKSGAFLSALRRTKVNDFRIEEAWKLEDLIHYIDHSDKIIISTGEE
ncbi:MAG: tRNA pseudouridine(55) synthase TruB [Saprospiraceae bacterium]|nr:tRNA pseudouridine(55) synthase TruB [Saprospiraceae bacterium]MCB9324788.1 tRNA pseudouridine(55) synthase TruB [Lewinellaceae bacterium]